MSSLADNAFHVLDLRNVYQCNKLRARKVWQVLFDRYREGSGSLSRMDNMLCDYDSLKWWFEQHDSFRLYFDYAKDMTDLKPDWYSVSGPTCLEIYYDQCGYKVYFYERELSALYARDEV